MKPAKTWTATAVLWPWSRVREQGTVSKEVEGRKREVGNGERGNERACERMGER